MLRFHNLSTDYRAGCFFEEIDSGIPVSIKLACDPHENAGSWLSFDAVPAIKISLHNTPKGFESVTVQALLPGVLRLFISPKKLTMPARGPFLRHPLNFDQYP